MSEKKRSMADTNFKMTLLIDKNEKRVLFAEAGKDCVDLLLSILSLPVSTLIRLVGKHEMVGSVANLYESIEAFDKSHIRPNIGKDSLLKLAAAPTGFCGLLDGASTENKKFYICSECSFYEDSRYVSDDPRAVCPACSGVMKSSITYVETCNGGGGFVEEGTYMVMDDLVVKPMSSLMSLVRVLTQLQVKIDVHALEEEVVGLGMNEVVKLLKASLVSKNVLTSVFINGKD